MEYDLQIINALGWSTSSKAFWDDAKKKIYDFSQTVSPELREILLFLLTATSKQEIDIWKIRLVKYHEALKQKAQNIMTNGLKKVYHIAEGEDLQKDKIRWEQLLKKL